MVRHDSSSGPEEIYSVSMVGQVCAVGGTGGMAAVWSLEARTQGPSEDGGGDDDDDDDRDSAFTADSDDASGFHTIGSYDGSMSPEFVLSHRENAVVAVNAACLCSSGHRLATGGTDFKAVLWCMSTREVLATFAQQLPPGGLCSLRTATINDLQISPGSHILAVGGYDSMLTMWGLPQQAAMQDDVDGNTGSHDVTD